MALWEAFTRAIYKETILVWALGMYGAGLAVAVITPQFHDKRKEDIPENPPSLKEVMAGIQKRLGH